MIRFVSDYKPAIPPFNNHYAKLNSPEPHTNYTQTTHKAHKLHPNYTKTTHKLHPNHTNSIRTTHKQYSTHTQNKRCLHKKDKVQPLSIKKWSLVEQDDERSLMQAVATHGPVSAAIDASALEFQVGGVAVGLSQREISLP